MTKFRKKPVVIEAIEYAKGKVPIESLPDWFGEALEQRVITVSPDETDDALYIKTLEGVMRCQRGDWIIRGVQGELYPCKPDIFVATYEPTP